MEKPSAAAQNLLKTGMKNTLAEETKSKNPKKGPANIAKGNYDKIQKDIQASIKSTRFFCTITNIYSKTVDTYI